MELRNTIDTADIKTSKLPIQLKIATEQTDLSRIETFREKLFRPLYPDLDDSHHDIYDDNSIILYTENSKGEVISTARIIFDGHKGFPADNYAKGAIDELRKDDLKLVEVGRFGISEEARKLGLLPIYYRAFYELCVENNIHSMVIAINNKSVGFHKKRIGAKMLVDRIDNIAGSDFCFACMQWTIKETLPKFKQWIGVDTPDEKDAVAPYPVTTWNTYSRFFASVYTHVQRELYQDAIQYLSGNVVDLGCGPARIAPLLAEKSNISAYTGVEYSTEMLEIAKFTLEQLSNPSFALLKKAIEDTSGQFSSAVSLQSYYAWAKPIQTLTTIYSLLEIGSLFVIATPNPSLDQEKLFQTAKNELMWHPDFIAFKAHNMKLAENQDAHFVTMDALLRQVQSVGFKIELCHQRHYEGGVNFIVCRKEA